MCSAIILVYIIIIYNIYYYIVRSVQHEDIFDFISCGLGFLGGYVKTDHPITIQHVYCITMKNTLKVERQNKVIPTIK